MYKGQWKRQGLTQITDTDKKQQAVTFMITEASVYEGIGIIHFADGSMYHGMTLNQQFNGKGRMMHANGDIYQGDWRDGKANGMGVFVDTNGSMYEGEWQDDQ